MLVHSYRTTLCFSFMQFAIILSRNKTKKGAKAKADEAGTATIILLEQKTTLLINITQPPLPCQVSPPPNSTFRVSIIIVVVIHIIVLPTRCTQRLPHTHFFAVPIFNLFLLLVWCIQTSVYSSISITTGTYLMNCTWSTNNGLKEETP